MTVTDTDRRIAAALGEAVGLMTNNYDTTLRYPYQQWTMQSKFTDADRAELAKIFAEGLTAISTPEPTWVTRHIPVPDVLPGMVTGDGTRVKDVVVRTSLATGEKTYDVQYPDFEDADLGRNETIGVRCDRVSRLPIIPRT